MAKLRAVLRRRWPILVATFVLGVVIALLTSAAAPERELTQYQAEQVILANRVAGNPANVPQDALKVTRGEVPEVAARALEQPDEATALAKKVTVITTDKSNSITLRVFDTDPDEASRIVTAFTAAFLEVVNAELRSEDQRLLDQLTALQADAEAKLAEFDAENGFVTRSDVPLPDTPTINALVAERTRLTEAVSNARFRLQEAELETSQRQPYTTLGAEPARVADSQLLEVPSAPIFRAGLLGSIGLLLGVGLIMIVERVNQRVDTRDELAQLVSVPIIAEIGRIPSRRRPGREDGALELDGVWSEHYRRVRSAIQFVQADAEAAAASAVPRSGQSAVITGHLKGTGKVPRVFLFASALPGEGKSTSVALTALALAETGTDTLVVNADFRRPMVERYLGAASTPSLADRAELSVDRPSIDDIVQPTDREHLWIAAGGRPTHEVGGRLDAAREVAHEAAGRGGTVLIDSSPLRVSNDPIDLLASVDEVILVVRAGRTTVKSIEDTIELLEMHHAPVLGVILIGTLATREMYAYYQSYYRQAEVNDAGGPSNDGGVASDQPLFEGTPSGDSDREREAAYAREQLDQFPDPPRYLPPPPAQTPPPFGHPG